MTLVKYRNTSRPSAPKARAAALAFTLAASLVALCGAAGLFKASRASAQGNTGKPARASRLEGFRRADESAAQRAAGRLARKSAKTEAATSALRACDTTGVGIPIGLNQTLNGTLTTDDCTLEDGTFYDIYNFNGVAGQQVSITMTSTQFNAYLFLVYDPTTRLLGEDDNGAGGLNARLPPGSGVVTLPYTGRYIILANAFPGPSDPDPTGTYSLTLTAGGTCPSTPVTVGQTVNNSLTTGDCSLPNNSRVDFYTFSGTAGQRLSISLSASFDAYLFLNRPAGIPAGEDDDGAGGLNSRLPPGSGVFTLPSTGTYTILATSFPPDLGNPGPTGSYTLTLTAGGTCPSTPVTVGQTVNNSLSGGDCLMADNTLVDFYTFSGTAGQQVSIALSSTAFDAYLFLNGPNGATLVEDDDGFGVLGGDARIPPGSGFFTLPSTGTYTILANSFTPDFGDPPPTGPYHLILSAAPPPVTNVQLGGAAFSATEGTDRSVLVNVTRTGDTTGESRVSYATTDGSASERKDYTAALGRLRFAAGETSKTFEIVITDDAFAEGQETFTVSLSEPVGATLGTTTSATVTINSNDVANGISPVRDASFNTEFFVRQHYADFLNRVPDAGGLQFWINNIESCGANAQCREVRKVDTSAAFFLAIEHQETGFLAVRTHKVSFGNLMGKPVPITLRSFLADSRQLSDNVIVGTPGWPEQLEANKKAYFEEFVTRSDFIARHPLSQSAPEYVDGLFADYLPTQDERALAITAFGGGGTTGRAAALRKVAESETVKQAETNGAFVLMQYFGYLRRNPDDTDFQGNPDPNFLGYQFWLNKLNQFNGNYVDAEMVKAFIQSIEYGDRFGQ